MRHWRGDLVVEYGPASRTGHTQGAAYPFTRLRADGVWTLDRDVPMDSIGPLNAAPVTGRFPTDLEQNSILALTCQRFSSSSCLTRA